MILQVARTRIKELMILQIAGRIIKELAMWRKEIGFIGFRSADFPPFFPAFFEHSVRLYHVSLAS